jgi:hypothetical protein
MVALAFHDGSKDKNPSANGRLFDLAIRLRCGSDFVHVEMAFDYEASPKSALCFSSVPKQGVRFTRIDLTDPCWRVVELPGVDAAPAKAAASTFLGQSYDWAGIIGFATPWGLHDDDDKFCSEACLRVLQDLGFYPGPKPWRTSPAQLFALVTAR